MVHNGVVGDKPECCSERTVVVGVKMDSHSKELLTWALVKVAQTGDRVIALHVLGDHEIVDQDGKSSLLSLVKAFDSVLAVYEGFCNLKQVDLKLKICRGSSVRKILVREAKAYFATEIIVGTAQNHHSLRSSVSVAKYCAKKLSKTCSVLAVSNGKIAFHKETTSRSNVGAAKGAEEHHRNGILSALQSSVIKEHEILLDGSLANSIAKCRHDTSTNSGQNSPKFGSDLNESVNNCSICSPDCQTVNFKCASSIEESSADGDECNSMAIVPVQKPEGSSRSRSLSTRESLEQKPGWPLLCRAISTNWETSRTIFPYMRQISVVQWAMRLPSRSCPSSFDSSDKQSYFQCDEGQFSELNGENGAIVPVGNGALISPSSPSSTTKSLPEELEGLYEKYSATCRLFQYNELLSATSKFSPDNLIGKGGNSEVYRCCLPDGKELAVKILKKSEDVLKEFVMEIEIITSLCHKNIISLFGFCFEDNNLLLVYDFLSKGSLEDNLHGNKKNPLAFGWSERYKVAVGIAEALLYLHNTCSQPVIHRDVKSSNVLLSDDFEPQLSDFGLAKWASTTSSYLTCTDVAGTFGYLAPEYFMYGKVNDKIDVFAFGVVLLELLSGRKPISSEYPKGQESLVMWARPILNGGKFVQILDPSLDTNYDCDLMERMVLAATLCIRRSPRARPHITPILKLLQGDVEMMKWARVQVDTSETCDATLQNSASEECDTFDDEGLSHLNLKNHLNLALLDVEEESLSTSSIEQSITLEDYLGDRWSRSSSFD
ncbi:putative receptor-like serine/threonine-protein kinase [Heracleum sosnowskyi]|uniref:Receptor-like serine/threonine-protein kinase n=1 Tax=Heracleum sosnowskyi TaxID=360622 RepID=A0AAD8MFT0_9APIA|nr:putative receptor-like serine/threonine-protein kinase [Heracleum sosnowskyi]